MLSPVKKCRNTLGVYVTAKACRPNRRFRAAYVSPANNKVPTRLITSLRKKSPKKTSPRLERANPEAATPTKIASGTLGEGF